MIETLTGAQLMAALLNGFKPPCGDVAGGTGRMPQVSGLKVTFHCNGTGAGGRLDRCVKRDGRRRSAPADTVRIVTNDFMFTGGDGYTAFAGGTDVRQPGDLLLDVAIDYITAELAGRAGGRRAAGRSVNSRIGGHGTIRVVAPALLERDAPLSVLLGALRGAEAGRGSTALISGEAGIGKTSLVRAFVGRARARLLVAACDDLVTPRRWDRCGTRRRAAGRWRGRWPRGERSSGR